MKDWIVRFVFNSSKQEMILTVLVEDPSTFLHIHNTYTISRQPLSPFLIVENHPFFFIPINIISLRYYKDYCQSYGPNFSTSPYSHLFKFIPCLGPTHVYVCIWSSILSHSLKLGRVHLCPAISYPAFESLLSGTSSPNPFISYPAPSYHPTTMSWKSSHYLLNSYSSVSVSVLRC